PILQAALPRGGLTPHGTHQVLRLSGREDFGWHHNILVLLSSRCARSLARSKNIPLGEALAGLARKGMHPTPRIDDHAPFPRFSIPDDAPPITLEQTLAAEDEP